MGLKGTVRAYIMSLKGGEEVLTRDFLHFSSFLVKIKRCPYTFLWVNNSVPEQSIYLRCQLKVMLLNRVWHKTCHAGFVSSSLFSTEKVFLVTKVSVHWQ